MLVNILCNKNQYIRIKSVLIINLQCPAIEMNRVINLQYLAWYIKGLTINDGAWNKFFPKRQAFECFFFLNFLRSPTPKIINGCLLKCM